ncbi:MAG: FAD-dependent oxidoreductase [Cyclobacteriaceae bacterium]
MEQNLSKYIIIGAGLSGLTSAYLLHKTGERDITILESRDRIGGRIHTKDNIDFGATWFQTHHQKVIDLLDELEVGKFHQYSKGKSVLVYSSMAPAHHFESNPEAPSAYRISGGSSAMIDRLASPFSENIKLGTTVTEIIENENGVSVVTENGNYQAEKVIITIPPLIATRISFSPELPSAVAQAMENTHTWMSNAIKIGMTFKAPFWKAKDLSGTLIGQAGPVVELYDHTNHKEEKYGLMGFINEALRDTTAEKRKERILTFLSKHLGEEVLSYETYEEKDWSKDKHTSCETIKSIYMSPQYGNPIFGRKYMNDKLIFSGAETSPLYGGYMDGAIFSGLKAANEMKMI